MCHWRLALWFQKLKPGPVSLSNCCPWIEIALSYFSSTTSACMTPCLLTWWQQTRPLNCKPAPGKCFLLLRVAVAMVSLHGNRTLRLCLIFVETESFTESGACPIWLDCLGSEWQGSNPLVFASQYWDYTVCHHVQFLHSTWCWDSEHTPSFGLRA